MRVEPQESQPRPEQHRAKPRQFPRAGNVGDLQIGTERPVPRDLAENAVGERDHQRTAYRQSVQTIRQVDRIGRAR